MRIVVVEDNKTNLMILSRLAAQVDSSDVLPFSNPREALSHVIEHSCDLLLVDYLMPEMNGIEFIQAIRDLPSTADVPAIVITSEADRAVRQAAIDAGATDFLTKPVDPIELKARLRNVLMLRRSSINEKNRADWLSHALKEATRKLREREQETVMRMARAIEFRDGGTGAHVDRIAQYAVLVGKALGFSCEDLNDLLLAAPMHDIGKLAVPDGILLKPGPLTKEERRIMEQHTVQGHAILAGSDAPLLQKAAEIALCHHERYDGQGYPNHIAGDAIPLNARIVAVVDVFDALTSERCYKPAWSEEQAIAYLTEKSGSQFDPICVSAFLLQWTIQSNRRPNDERRGFAGGGVGSVDAYQF